MSQEILSKFFTKNSTYSLVDCIQNDSFKLLSSRWIKENGSSQVDISSSNLVDYLNSQDNLRNGVGFSWQEVLLPEANGGSSLKRESYLDKLTNSGNKNEGVIYTRSNFVLGGRIIWFNPISKKLFYSGVVTRLELSPIYLSLTPRTFG